MLDGRCQCASKASIESRVADLGFFFSSVADPESNPLLLVGSGAGIFLGADPEPGSGS
jgi:hypothetical protein